MPTLDRLIDQAVAIAREVAIGSTGVSAVLIALTDDKPAVLFLDVDDDPASQATMEAEIDGFLDRHDTESWLYIAEVEMLAGRLLEPFIRCVAHDCGLERSVLLRPARDRSGRICELAEVPPLPPPVVCLAPRYLS
jgi:hypothetical protein